MFKFWDIFIEYDVLKNDIKHRKRMGETSIQRVLYESNVGTLRRKGYMVEHIKAELYEISWS